MKKIIEFIKMNKIIKIILTLIIIFSIIGLIIGSILICNSKVNTVTKLEKIKIEELSNQYMDYMEYIDNSNSKEIDRYIVYVLNYSYGENGKNELSTDEILKIIKNIFKVKITKDDILNIGITSLMLDEKISYDSAIDTYTLNIPEKSGQGIANIIITKYDIDNIKKENDTYIVEYNKYIVENPYEILNYYTDKNADKKDIDAIKSYLSGKSNVKTIKKYITKDNAKSVSKLKVTYYVDKNILLSVD